MNLNYESALKAIDQQEILSVVVTTSSDLKVTRKKNLFGLIDALLRRTENSRMPLQNVSIGIEFAEGEWIDVLPYLQKSMLEKAKEDQKRED